MLRISNPRMLYSPPRNSFSNVGSCTGTGLPSGPSCCDLPYGVMYSTAARNPNDVRWVCCKYQTASPFGLTKLLLPPRPARSNDAEKRRPLVGKVGVATVVKARLGPMLALLRVTPCV